MKLSDALPVKFPKEIKRWLMEQAKKREDKSVSAVVREIVQRERDGA